LTPKPGYLNTSDTVLKIFFIRSLNARVSFPLAANAINPAYPSAASITFDELTVDQVGELFSGTVWRAMTDVGAEEGILRGKYISTSSIDRVSNFVLSEEGAIAQRVLWVCFVYQLSVAKRSIYFLG
jgi:hypothetical protein